MNHRRVIPACRHVSYARSVAGLLRETNENTTAMVNATSVMT